MSTRQIYVAGVLMVLAVLLLAAGCMRDAQAQSTLPPWITIAPAADCSAGCWRVDRERTRYLPEGESNGLHHAFIKVFSDREQQGGVAWVLEWPGGRDNLLTKPFPDWADAPLWACFFPDQGEVGPYSLYVQEKERSDVVQGLGLPYCHHESIEVVYEWTEGGEIPTPTATPTPAYRLYLPLVHERRP